MTTQGYKTNALELPAPRLCMIDEAVGCTQTLTIMDDGALSAYDSKTTEIKEWMEAMSLRLVSYVLSLCSAPREWVPISSERSRAEALFFFASFFFFLYQVTGESRRHDIR
jgi:hypothetical protein